MSSDKFYRSETSGRVERPVWSNDPSPAVGAAGGGGEAPDAYSWERSVYNLCRGLELVLEHHGMNQKLRVSFRAQVHRYMAGCDEATFVSRAKYLLCAPMARYLGCEAPPSPGMVFTWSGGVSRWLRARMRFNSKNTHLWWSYYQAKRSCAPISEEYVRTVYEKHRRQMAAPDPADEDTLDLVLGELEPVLSRVRDRMEKLNPESLRFTRKTFQASGSACFEASRESGGQCGFLARNFASPTDDLYGRELIAMRFFPYVEIDGELRMNATVSFYRPLSIGDFYEAVNEEEDCLWPLSADPRREEIRRLDCMIQAVIEPLKARIISKGPAVPYFLSKPFQHYLHDTMRSMPCFRLIGRPISPTDLTDIADYQRTDYYREWFSIDYSAATDGLSASLSRRILERLLPCWLYPHERSRYLSVLAPHKCSYPSGEGIEPVDQVNGQLMGSILSFPVLCLANLGVYLAVTAERVPSLETRLRQVLVNGDDMLYAAPPSDYSVHREIGRACGLELSVGKSYRHPVFASANSTSFHLDLNSFERVHVRQIGYLNSGLFYGNSKVMRVDSIDGKDARSCGPLEVLGALLDGCWSRLKERQIAKRYLSRCRDEILLYDSHRNWFIHPSLGGLGARLPYGFKFRVNENQWLEVFRCLTALVGPDLRLRFRWKVVGPSPATGLVRDLFSTEQPPWLWDDLGLEARPLSRTASTISSLEDTTIVRRRFVPRSHRSAIKQYLLIQGVERF
jgi:hypothetical protein